MGPGGQTSSSDCEHRSVPSQVSEEETPQTGLASQGMVAGGWGMCHVCSASFPTAYNGCEPWFSNKESEEWVFKFLRK